MDLKKVIYILVSVLAISLIVAIIAANREKEVKPYSYEVAQKKFENDDTFLFIIGQTTCGACIRYKEGALKSYINKKPDVEVVYIDIDEIVPEELLDIEDKDEQTEKIKAFYNDFLKDFDRTIDTLRTPTTFFVKKGDVNTNDVLVGNVSYKELKDFVDRHNQ